MNICLETLTDEKLQYLVKCNLRNFLEPVNKNRKKYKQYISDLGKMKETSYLV